MGHTPHPAVQLLVDAVRERLRSPTLPTSAVRGSVLEALQQTELPEGRLSPWVSKVIWDASGILCRRLGVDMPDIPSFIGEEMPRDLASETVQAVFNELDPRHAAVLRMLEVRDARSSQVAVTLSIPPKRVEVIARQGRAEVAAVLARLAQD